MSGEGEEKGEGKNGYHSYGEMIALKERQLRMDIRLTLTNLVALWIGCGLSSV